MLQARSNLNKTLQVVKRQQQMITHLQSMLTPNGRKTSTLMEWIGRFAVAGRIAAEDCKIVFETCLLQFATCKLIF